MTIGEFVRRLNQLFPLALQEDYDNSGLLTGNPSAEISGVLISLDCTEEIVQEAIEKNCNVILSHHPIVFKGLKKLTGANYVERTVIKAIQNNIALIAFHTNVDNHPFGVNDKIAQLLELQHTRILQPVHQKLNKIVTYVPSGHLSKLDEAVFNAGGGKIGNYDQCRFAVSGEGTFRPTAGANPFVGTVGEREFTSEFRVEYLSPSHLSNAVLAAIQQAHPYEEVAYEIYPLLNQNPYQGAGKVGELKEALSLEEILNRIKTTFKAVCIRHTKAVGRPIKTIALCGGSGSFLIQDAIRSGADLYLTSDVKYHEFFDAENKLVIADIGHYESEQFTIQLFGEVLKENFSNFAVHLTEINTNPINYF